MDEDEILLLQNLSQFQPRVMKKIETDEDISFTDAIMIEYRNICLTNSIDLNGQTELMKQMKSQQEARNKASADVLQKQVIHPLFDIGFMDDIIQSQQEARKEIERIPSDQALKKRQDEARQAVSREQIVQNVAYSSVNDRQNNLSQNQQVIIRDEFSTTRDQKYMTPLGAQMLIGQIPSKNIQVEKDLLVDETQQRLDYRLIVGEQLQISKQLPIQQFFEPRFQKQQIDESTTMKQLLQLIVDNFPPQFLVHIRDLRQFVAFLQQGSINAHDICHIANLIRQYPNNGQLSQFDYFHRLSQSWNNDLVITKDQIDYTISVNQFDKQSSISSIQEAIKSINDCLLKFNIKTEFVDLTAQHAIQFGQLFINRQNELQSQLIQRRLIMIEKAKHNYDKQRTFEKSSSLIATKSEKFAQSLRIGAINRPQIELEAYLEDYQLVQDEFMDVQCILNFSQSLYDQNFRDEINQVIQISANTTLFNHFNECPQYQIGPTLDEYLVDIEIDLVQQQIVEPLPNQEFDEFMTQQDDFGHSDLSKTLADSFLILRTPLAEQFEVFEYICSHPNQPYIGQFYQQISENYQSLHQLLHQKVEYTLIQKYTNKLTELLMSSMLDIPIHVDDVLLKDEIQKIISEHS